MPMPDRIGAAWGTLAGVALGFLLAEGSRVLRERSRRRRLRRALEAECRSLVAQIPQLVAMTERCVQSLRQGRAFPGQHVRAASGVYNAVIAELAPYLTLRERNVLHVCYERLRVADELLAEHFSEAVGWLAQRHNLPGFDPIGTYGMILGEQIESYRLVQRLLRSFLDGTPDDVFYVETSDAERDNAEYV